MIGRRPAAYPLSMNVKSPAAHLLDKCAGYAGLFLIGVIGWWCDRFGGSPDRNRPARRVESGVWHTGRFVD